MATITATPVVSAPIQFFVEGPYGVVRVKLGGGGFSLSGRNCDLSVAEEVVERLAPYPQLLSFLVRENQKQASYAVTPQDVKALLRLTTEEIDGLCPQDMIVDDAVLYYRDEVAI